MKYKQQVSVVEPKPLLGSLPKYKYDVKKYINSYNILNFKSVFRIKFSSSCTLKRDGGQ